MSGTSRCSFDEASQARFPAHALLILEERLRERQEAGGVKMPEGMERDELARRILIAAALSPTAATGQSGRGEEPR